MKKGLISFSCRYLASGWIAGLALGFVETVVILFQYSDRMLPAWRLGRTTLFVLRPIFLRDPRLIMVPLDLDRYQLPTFAGRVSLLFYMMFLYAMAGAVAGLLFSLPMYLWYRLRRNGSWAACYSFILSGMALFAGSLGVLLWLNLWVFPMHREFSRPFLLVDGLIALGVLVLGFLHFRFLLPRLPGAGWRQPPAEGAMGTRWWLPAASGVLLTVVGLTVPLQFIKTSSRPAITPERVFSADVTVERPPNIVFISIDTLRPDHLSCYGYGRNTSPNIDKLASRGILFSNAYSQAPWTLPAHMTMFTSLYSHVHKVYDDARVLSPSIRTLPERLKKEGYETYGVISGKYLAGTYGFSRGFDGFDEEFGMGADRITELAVSFLNERKQPDAPFFLFVHYYDPHSDYDAPEPYKVMYDANYSGSVEASTQTLMDIMFFGRHISEADLDHIVARYDGEIAYCDAQLGVLFAELDRLHLSESTLFVLTSDHGEEFMDHGLMYHRHTLYDELLHVPLIVSFANVFTGGKTVTSTVRHVDILPTIMDLVGAGIGPLMQGKTLIPLMQGDEVHEERPCFAEVISGYQAKASLSVDGTKVIQNLDRVHGTEMYDIQQDSKEISDLSDTSPALLDSMTTRLYMFVEDSQSFARGTGFRRFRRDKELLKKLKSLGYVN